MPIIRPKNRRNEEGKTMMKTSLLTAVLAIALASTSYAAEEGEEDSGHGTGHVIDYDFSFEGPFGSYDKHQLQRGLQVYVEICSGCHGLQYIPFRALAEEGGPHYHLEDVREFASDFDAPDDSVEAMLGDTRPATEIDYFPGSNLSNAPDLSLMAKARAGFHGPLGSGISQLINGMGGPEYIASILTGFTGEEKEEYGAIFYENTAYPGGWIAMAPPLYGDDMEYSDGTAATVEQEAQDVAAFLMWAAEPGLNDRKHTGFVVVIFLAFVTVLVYLTNKKLWLPHKHRKKDDDDQL